MKRTTIKDIAQRAGVNVSTVSRALKDHPDIGVILREKIKNLAQEMHYHPNMRAVQLRQKKSNTIALIIPESSMFFFPSVIKGITSVVQELGYCLLVLQSGENFEQEKENVRFCLENGVEGLLISVSNQTQSWEHLEEISEMGIPVVQIDKMLEGAPFDAVIIDDIAATHTTVNYLLTQGCKRILGVFGHENMSITQKRWQGFQEALRSFGSQPEDHRILFVSSPEEAYAQTLKAWEQGGFEGIFAMSDEVLCGIMPALREKNVHIGQDCLVVGFSDGFLPPIFHPNIGYLHHDGQALGRLAAQHLVAQFTTNKADKATEQLFLETKLVV